METIYQFRKIIMQHLPELSQPQATVLAMWVVGSIKAKSSTRSDVTRELAGMLGQSNNTIEHRLGEWYKEAEHKSGEHRVTLQVQHLFASLLVWIISLLPKKRIALALDASNLYDQLTVLCVSVLIDHCAIPVAWCILPETQEGKWNPHWINLIGCLAAGLREWEVWVYTDRGLWSPLLYNALVRVGWHPLMRIGGDKFFQQAGHHGWLPIKSLLGGKGQEASYSGRAFKTCPLACSLIVFWGEEAKEPWYLLTDTVTANARGYAMRFWIEHQFKTIKSRGCHWERTRKKDSERASRLWLVYALELLWSINVGAAEESKEAHRSGAAPCRTYRKRISSLFARGITTLQTAIARGWLPKLLPFTNWDWTPRICDTIGNRMCQPDCNALC